MAFIEALPQSPGTYRHRWIDPAGVMKEQVLFVGYTNASAPKLQGTEPNKYMPRKLKCCRPDEQLNADRMTPEQWGGWWEHIQEVCPRCGGTREIRKTELSPHGHPMTVVDNCPDCMGPNARNEQRP